MLFNFNKWLIKVLYGLIGPTLRFVGDPLAEIDKIKGEKQNVLFAVWHESSAACFWIYKDRQAGVLLEDSPRGRVLECLAQRLGFHTLRIADNPKDSRSVRATIQLIKYLRTGRDGTIALDGPNGPAHVPKPGIFYIAQKSGNIILPIGVWYKHQFTCFWRWDKYQIPWPFTKTAIAVGAPFQLPEQLNKDNEALALTELVTVMEKINIQAKVLGQTFP